MPDSTYDFMNVNRTQIKSILVGLSIIFILVPDILAAKQDQAETIVNEYMAAIKSRDEGAIWATWEKLNADQDLLVYIQKEWPNQYNSYQLLKFAKQLREDNKNRDEVYTEREKRIQSQRSMIANFFDRKLAKTLTNGEVVRRYPNVVTLTNRDTVMNNPNLVSIDNREAAIKYPNQILPSNQEIMESRITSSFGPIEREYGVNPDIN